MAQMQAQMQMQMQMQMQALTEDCACAICDERMCIPAFLHKPLSQPPQAQQSESESELPRASAAREHENADEDTTDSYDEDDEDEDEDADADDDEDFTADEYAFLHANGEEGAGARERAAVEGSIALGSISMAAMAETAADMQDDEDAYTIEPSKDDADADADAFKAKKISQSTSQPQSQSQSETQLHVPEAARLPCGHAFHAACLVRALMQRPACPTCLYSAHGQTAAGHDEDEDEVYEDDDEDEDEDGNEDAEAEGNVHDVRVVRVERMRQLNVVRSALPELCARMREERRKYSVLRAQLRSRRRELVGEALHTLRREAQGAWRAAHRRMQAMLTQERETLENAMKARFGSAARVPLSRALFVPSSVLASNMGSMEPVRRAFWTN